MDNDPNNPMTWYDLLKILMDQPLKKLKQPVSIEWEDDEIAEWAKGTNQQYPSDGQKFDLSKLELTQFLFTPTEDGNDCPLTLVVSPEFVKPNRYTIRINRIVDFDVYAENVEQAEEMGRKIANGNVPKFVTDYLNFIVKDSNFDFDCVHDEVLEVTDGIFSESECEEILKG